MTRLKQTDDGHVVFELTPEDLALVEQVELTGMADVYEIADKQMCVMQLVTLLSTETRTLEDLAREARESAERDYATSPEGLTDYPECASESVTSAMIDLNDSCTRSQRQRLKKLVPRVIGTCPVKRVDSDTEPTYFVRDQTPEYLELERRRKAILSRYYDVRQFNPTDEQFSELVEILEEAIAVS